jgi:hypothetical protein
MPQTTEITQFIFGRPLNADIPGDALKRAARKSTIARLILQRCALERMRHPPQSPAGPPSARDGTGAIRGSYPARFGDQRARPRRPPPSRCSPFHTVVDANDRRSGASRWRVGRAASKNCWKYERTHLACRRERAGRCTEKRRNNIGLRHRGAPIGSHQITIQPLIKNAQCHETRTNQATIWPQ